MQEFSTSGAFIRQFDEKGSGNGKSNQPYGIAADPISGNLYVSEVANNRVQIFSLTGGFIAAFGSPGSGAGQLSIPEGVAVAPSGGVYLADSANRRVAEWGPAGPALPRIDLCGTITANQTLTPRAAAVYVLTCSVTVASGATLTVEPGTVIKATSGASLTVQGSLIAQGLPGLPAVFTSYKDDSAGGDSNNDGSATAPEAGDWVGIVTAAASGAPTPSIVLNYAHVSYATTGVMARQSNVAITNSEFDYAVRTGVDVYQAPEAPRVQNSSFNHDGVHLGLPWWGTPLSIDSAVLNLDYISGNSGAGNNFNGTSLSGTVTANSKLTSSPGWAVGPGSGDCLGYGDCYSLAYGLLTVATGVTVSVPAGTIVKAQAGASIELKGNLVAEGTAKEPAVFTSYKDDSAGGDSNNDGSATAPEAGDWVGIVTAAASGAPTPSIVLNYAHVSYATTGVMARQSNVAITNSEFDYAVRTGVDVYQAPEAPRVQNSSFNHDGVHLGLPWWGTPLSIDSAVLNLDYISGNSGAGNNFNGTSLSGTVTANSELTSSPGWAVGPGSGDCLGYGDCYSLAYGLLTVATGVTVSVPAGTIVKAQAGASIELKGNLVAEGTAKEPAVFTSYKDDSAGGDSNNDGSATAPEAGDWVGIKVQPTGSATLLNTTLEYASTALFVAEEAEATIHGSILNSTVGVYANTYVDATNVDWGSPSGPAPIGSGTPIQGEGVDVAPWVGFVAPPSRRQQSPCQLRRVPASRSCSSGHGGQGRKRISQSPTKRPNKPRLKTWGQRSKKSTELSRRG